MTARAVGTQTPTVMRRLLSAVEKGFKLLLFGALSLLVHSRKVRAVDPAGVRSVLVIRQHNQLGDMLCVIPLLRALKATYPGVRVGVLARPLNGPVLEGNPHIDELFIFDKRAFLRKPTAFFSFLHRIRKRRFDLAVTPATVSMSVTSDLLALLSRARIRIGPGMLNGKRNVTGYVYNVRVGLDWRGREFVHHTERNLDVARILELKEVSRELEMGLTEEELAHGRSFVEASLKQRRLVVAFHPGAAKVQNRWDALRFADLANRCAEILGAFLVVSAGPDDEEPVREMLLNMPNEHLVTWGIPLRPLAGLFAHCDAVVTNDTGIMHVAAAAGAPVLSLFGPTDPLQWAPLGGRHRFILGRECRLDGITVEKAWEVLNAMLGERRE